MATTPLAVSYRHHPISLIARRRIFQAAKIACDDLARRMSPHRREGEGWTDLVHRSYRAGVDLTASHMYDDRIE